MLDSKLLARIAVFFVVFFFADLGVAEGALWRDLSQYEVASEELKRQQRQLTAEARYLRIDRDGLTARITTGLASQDRTFLLELPVPDGGFRTFEFQPARTMIPALAQKFPNIQAFSGRSIVKGLATAQM